MKKTISLFLALGLVMIALSGCGNPSFTAKDFVWDEQVTWKSTKADIKKLYSRSDGAIDPLSSGFGNSLEYYDGVYLPAEQKTIAGIRGFFITFDFMEESDYLKSIELFKSSNYSAESIRSDYETLKKAYTEKYGEPTKIEETEERNKLTWDFDGMLITLDNQEFTNSKNEVAYSVVVNYKAQTEEKGYQALEIPKNNLDGV